MKVRFNPTASLWALLCLAWLLPLAGAASAQDQAEPVVIPLPGGTSAVMVVAGPGCSLVAVGDGRLYSWGFDADGRLGDGGNDNRSVPGEVTLSGGVPEAFRHSTAGHELAIGDDGQLYASGDNRAGQIGDGSLTDRPEPVRVTLAPGVTPTALAAGGYHSLAIGSDGRLYTWGWNRYGQLGDGSNAGRSTPQAVELPGGVAPVRIAAGYAHSLVVGSDGRLYGWGWNNHGQVGDGSTLDRPAPVAVKVPGGIVSISAGLSHSLAVSRDGRLYGWGEDGYGQASGGSALVALDSLPPASVEDHTPGVPEVKVGDTGDGRSVADGPVVSAPAAEEAEVSLPVVEADAVTLSTGETVILELDEGGDPAEGER